MGVLCDSRSSCPQFFGRAMDISSRQSAIILFILVAVSLLFRFDGMVESIWYDEVYRTKAIYFERSIWKILFVDCHNFLYNALMHILIHVFGDSEVLIRFPSLVMSYSSALIMQKWISDRWGRLFSVFVFAWFVFSPFHVWYSTEAKNNAMVMLFTVLIFVSYDALIARQDVKSSNAAIAASVLGIYTDFLLFFPILAAWILLYASGVRKHEGMLAGRNKRVIWWTLVLIAPIVIHKAIIIEKLFRSYLKFLNFQQLLLFLGDYLVSGNAVMPIDTINFVFNAHDIFTALFYVSSIILVLICIVSGSKWLIANSGSQIIVYFLVPIVIIMLLSLYMHLTGRQQVYLERSLASVTFYFFGIMLFSGVRLLPTGWMQKLVVVFFVMLNIFASSLMLTVHKADWTVYKPNPDWKSASSYVLKEDANFSSSIIVGTSPLNALQYYMARSFNGNNDMFRLDSTQNSRFVSWDSSSKRDFVDVAKSKHALFAYIVRNVYWPVQIDNLLQQVDDDTRVKLVDQRSFFGIELYKYQIL